MPELPEVETVRKTLKPLLINNKIINILVNLDKIIKTPNIEQFKKKIIGQKINNIYRNGKLLIFLLDNYVLLSHLRMEGKYFFKKKDQLINLKHILLILELENNCKLLYQDTRHFGTFHLQNKNKYKKLKPYIKIGPDPFKKKITSEYLKHQWKNNNKMIKPSLLEQNIMSGLGNIYANEVLFYAKIHPQSTTKNLQIIQLQNIIDKSKIILKKAIKLGGTTINSYTSNLEVKGNYQKHLKVYNRFKMLCFECQNLINKIKINCRSTYFCNNCQIKY